MSASEDFGEPRGSDLLLEIGQVYFRRKLLPQGIRAFLSGVPAEIAAATVQTILIELRDNDGH